MQSVGDVLISVIGPSPHGMMNASARKLDQGFTARAVPSAVTRPATRS